MLREQSFDFNSSNFSTPISKNLSFAAMESHLLLYCTGQNVWDTCEIYATSRKNG